jgi:curved DNA-binding protein CbpA
LLQSPHGGTYYDVLGVPRDATDEVIRAAFRVAAKALHPDVNGGDAEAQKRLREVIAAYQLLRSPQKRAVYDQRLAANEQTSTKRSPESDRLSIAAAALAALVSASIVIVAVRISSEPPTSSYMEGRSWQKAANDKPDEQARESLTQLTNVPTVKKRVEVASTSSAHPLQHQAANFIVAQVCGWSSINTIDLVSLANAYADEVVYYGSVKSIQAVLLDKRRLMERWPERVYQVRSERIAVQCAANRCRVHGLVDWKVRSEPRAAFAKGLSRFDYEIVPRDDAFAIVREESSVVRTVQAISGRWALQPGQTATPRRHAGRSSSTPGHPDTRKKGGLTSRTGLQKAIDTTSLGADAFTPISSRSSALDTAGAFGR